MIILLSPSKTLDESSPIPDVSATTPQFLDEAASLVHIARNLSVDDLKSLMKISDKLAELNHQRFADFTTPFTPDNARPALFTFKGDVYDGLDAPSFSAADRDYAQSHLRILSGLYGLLRPLDFMQPYRLEMGRPLANPHGKNLYAFWGKRITDAINQAAAESHSTAIINLASDEYFRSVKPDLLTQPLITPIFKERKGDDYKVIGLMAKKARGRMAAWLIQQAVTDPHSIQHYALDNYQFNPEMSNDTQYIFTRSHLSH